MTAKLPDWAVNANGKPAIAAPAPIVRTSAGDLDARTRAYCDAAIRDECLAVATAPKGTRNDTLNVAALKLGTFVGAGWISEAEVVDLLAQAAIDSGLVADDGMSAAHKTIQSGLSKGRTEPRTMPPPEPVDTSHADRLAASAAAKQRAEAGPSSEPAAQAEAGRAAETASAIQLLNYREYREQMNRPTAYLIKHLVRLGTVISIGARPGGGKTSIMIEIARCLDTGTPFLGRDTKEAVVVYIAAEDADDIANRLQALDALGILIVISPEGVPLTKPARAKAIVAEIIKLARLRRPGVPVFIVIDTLRAALGGQSVLEDKITSPALNAMRELAEDEGAVIAILNHTNRDNPKQTKGETLEAVAALELILLPGEAEWYTLHVGKNRSGPGNRQIGRVRYSSIDVGDVSAAVVAEMVPDESTAATSPERKQGKNQTLLFTLFQRLVFEVREFRQPYGHDGPRVKAVGKDDLREAFRKRKAGAATTIRKGFDAALSHFLETGVIVQQEDGDGTWLWFASKDDEQGKTTEIDEEAA